LLSFENLGTSVNRFVNYVLDLLSEEDIHAALGEAGRLLEPGGLLCLTELSYTKLPS
jgi:ubiquinone/menaquinone biosynthesis C-methylase UbiE